MRLKRVEMIGFKSFMDRTVLDFRNGITTVLGPNGCGKSNVVDAVRWVLGEQSAKQLRGEKMEDVIFKGTRSRKPLSVAEVSLVFDNSDGALSVAYDEVAITRRVDRSGGSDYFLNKTPCRLKDIKDLFYDTGVGNNAYSVIEQEIVGQVLDPNENKVRTILEEGSGIVRYKVKRKEALRKLDLTERDLLRVEDIIEEIGKQVRSLARQVGKARRHQRLFGEVRSLELIRAWMRMRDLQKELQALKEREHQLRAEGAGDDAEAARIHAQITEMKPEIDALEEHRRQRALGLSQVETELNQIEGELLVLREKIDAGGRRQTEIADELLRSRERGGELLAEQEKARLERRELAEQLQRRESEVRSREQQAREAEERYEAGRRQLAEAQQLSLGFLKEEAEQKRDITAAETRLESLRSEHERIEADLRESERRLQELRETLTQLETRITAADHERAALEADLGRAHEGVTTAEHHLQEAMAAREGAADELARVESRHEVAQRIAKEYEGYRTGAAALLRDPELTGRLHGAMAERLQVDKGYEAAFELLFGEDADALLVGNVRDAGELADRLAREGLGQASFLADPGTGHRHLEPREDLPGRPAVELVRVDGEVHGPIHRWLARVRVVEENRQAIEAMLEHAGEGFSFLSREGLFLRHDGLVRGGAGARRQLSIFGRREQLEALQHEMDKLRGVLQERQAQQEQRRGGVEQAKESVRERERELKSIAERAAQLARELASRRSLLEREEEHLRRCQSERTKIDTEIQAILAQVEGMRMHLGRHGEDQEASQRRVEELAGEAASLEEQREAARAALSESRLQLAHERGLDRELDSRLERLQHMDQEVAQRVGRLETERTELSENLETWSSTEGQRKQRLADLYGEREGWQEQVREAQEAIEERRADLETLQESLRDVSERQRRKETALHDVDTQSTRLGLMAQNLEDRILEKFQVQIEEGYRSIEPDKLPRELVHEDDSYQLEQVEQLLNERQERLEKLGPVNFVALDEYDEKKARLEFLEKQRDDLLQSKEDLLKAIDRINRTARQMFHETFEQVRSHFREIFSTLFQGGEADLVQHRTDDPLESDIQVIARPSGKRVDSVSLLSGGERALTAIALLFAVYLIKPSPFCLLDEVDAPLDDMNIGRFVRLLEKFAEHTQFIVITHNKLTMEAADHLYGVTMEESGVSRLVSVSFDELDTDDPIAALENISVQRQEAAADAGKALAKAGSGNGESGPAAGLVAEAAAGASSVDRAPREMED